MNEDQVEGDGVDGGRVDAGRVDVSRPRGTMMIARSAILAFAGLAAALLLAGSPAPAVAAGAESESWGYDLSHDLMSPFCPGRTLATCPSPQAAELVQWIVMQEAAGASREQVVEMLIERFGEEILGAPPAQGITLWAYVFPVLGFLVGGGLAFLVLRRIVASGPGVDGSGTWAEASVPTPASRPGSTGVAGGFEGPELRETSLAGAAQPESEDDDLARIVDADLDRRSA